MQVRLTHDAPGHVHTGALVVPFFSDTALESTAKEIDDKLGGVIADALAAKEIQGRLGENVLIYAKGEPYQRVLAVSLGERARFEPHFLARYAGSAVRYLGRRNIESIAIVLPLQAQGQEAACASFVSEGAITGIFETTLYQEKPDRRNAMTEVAIIAGGLNQAELERGIARGTALGNAVNLARRLAITPANLMTPTRLAEEATKVAEQNGLEIDVLDEARASREGMGSFLSVARGSAQPPKFIVMRYNGDPSSKELLALVGKGITFDTGGISIKPAERMEDMKYDMSGGAGVIAAMSAIAKLKPKLNVVAIVPATENMPGGKATKPGDIVTAMNGKTIEVINTDAEGRLILADGICYANKLGATRIVDAATLTGACVIALGHASSAADNQRRCFRRPVLSRGQAHRRALLANAVLRGLHQRDEERHRGFKEHRRPSRRHADRRRLSTRVRGQDAVGASRYRRHGLSRKRVALAGEGPDGNARTRLSLAGRIARRPAPDGRLRQRCEVSRAEGVKASESARPYEPEKNPAIRRLTAGAIKRRKGKALFPVATAYDAPFGQFVERAGIDVILVGDSVGNVVLGFDETTPVTLESIIYHTQAVVRGTTRAHIMADMPFGSYQVSNEDALRSAIRLVKEGGGCSVKLEGGRDQTDRIRAITGAGIPVVGHIGVTPQTAGLGPGFKMRTHRDRLIDDARAVEAAGAYAIVLEVVDYEISREITEMLSIPTIGIGSGPHCDSQVLVLHDILGMYPHSPSFAKRYAEIGQLATQALEAYAEEVRDRTFPC